MLPEAGLLSSGLRLSFTLFQHENTGKNNLFLEIWKPTKLLQQPEGYVLRKTVEA